MNFAMTDEHTAVRAAVADICRPFSDDDWLRKDREGDFPEDFYWAMADADWLGISMPTASGGAGLGISDAALMIEAVSGSGAGHVGHLGDPHELIRPAPGGGAWQRRAQGALAAADHPGQAQGWASQ